MDYCGHMTNTVETMTAHQAEMHAETWGHIAQQQWDKDDPTQALSIAAATIATAYATIAIAIATGL